MWSGIPISLRIFQFVVIHTVKGFSIVNEGEADVFLELPCFLCDPMDVGNLISGFSNKFVHLEILSSCTVKPSLKNFECYTASVWNEHIPQVSDVIHDLSFCLTYFTTHNILQVLRRFYQPHLGGRVFLFLFWSCCAACGIFVPK